MQQLKRLLSVILQVFLARRVSCRYTMYSEEPYFGTEPYRGSSDYSIKRPSDISRFPAPPPMDSDDLRKYYIFNTISGEKEHSAKPKKRKINYYSTKINAGYLYSVGARALIAEKKGTDFVMIEDKNTEPLPIAIVDSYGDSIGTYGEIISVESTISPSLGKRSNIDFFSGVRRIDSGAPPNKTRCYLYGATSEYNRYFITPPYYKEGDEFKIKRKGKCLEITPDNNLMEMPCVDDTTDGLGTEENDRQLFKFCRENSPESCRNL